MCKGRDDVGGPCQCPKGAALKVQRAHHNVDQAQTAVTVLDRELSERISDIEVLEYMRASLAGELPPAREHQLIARAYAVLDDRTHPNPGHAADESDECADADRFAQDRCTVDDDRDAWERLSRAAEPRPSDDQLRVEYESSCAATGIEPTDDGFRRYRAAEDATRAAARPIHCDILSGKQLADSRHRLVDAHRDYAHTLSEDDAEHVLASRFDSDDLNALVAARDRARHNLADATTAWDAAQQAYRDDPTRDNLAAIAATRKPLNAANAEYLIARDDLDHYKDITAQYAGRVGELYDFPAYTGATLGNCYPVGEFEVGGRDWLENRQNGLGGSDVAAVLGYNKYETAAAIRDTKLTPITDEQVAEQLRGKREFTGAAPRGDAWEPVLAKRFATEHPELRLQRTKATWRAADNDFQQPNIDGVIVDVDGTPTALWEAKTASNAADWDNGIPAGYRAQLGHMMDATGLDRAALTVNINDNETRTYWMRRDEPIVDGGRSYTEDKQRLADTWAKWQAIKAAPQTPPKHNNGTFSWVQNPGAQSSLDRNADTARQLASYRGCSDDQAAAMIRDRIAAGAKPDAAVRSLYLDYHPARDPQRRFVMLDFEANGNHPGKHEVIQTGYEVVDGAGTVHARETVYHGINPRSASTVGTGRTDIHHISLNTVIDTTPFATSTTRDNLAALAADPHVTFVAHNVTYERNHLRANGIDPRRVIDTMFLSKKFDHHSTGAKLSDFTAAHGVDYRDAHDAGNDTSMMRRALLNFWDDAARESHAAAS